MVTPYHTIGMLRAIRDDHDLPPCALGIALTINDAYQVRADLSQADIAAKVGLCDRHVRRALKLLFERGYIQSVDRVGQAGKIRVWQLIPRGDN